MIFIVTKIFTLRYLLFFHRNGTLLAQNVGKKFRPTVIKLTLRYTGGGHNDQPQQLWSFTAQGKLREPAAQVGDGSRKFSIIS